MLMSMTGFARTEKHHTIGHLCVELKSTNHRYLDISVRLPEMLRTLEMDIRLLLKNGLGRGKIECALQFQPDHESTAMALNIDLLKQIAKADQQIRTHFPDVTQDSPLTLLKWPGVIQPYQPDEATIKQAVLELLKTTIQLLLESRADEGQALKCLLQTRLEKIEQELMGIIALMPEIVTWQRDKLIERMENAGVEFDPGRLEQELVFLAQRIDVAEELDRLSTHLKEVRKILDAGGIVGRRLDFMMQELNREANTLSSKSINANITHSAVEIKVLIEQMREQIQNIE